MTGFRISELSVNVAVPVLQNQMSQVESIKQSNHGDVQIANVPLHANIDTNVNIAKCRILIHLSTFQIEL